MYENVCSEEERTAVMESGIWPPHLDPEEQEDGDGVYEDEGEMEEQGYAWNTSNSDELCLQQ